LRALGVTGAIKSPSYTLLETYELPAVEALHLDLYRLNDPEELEHLGLADYFRPGTLWLVEWPEKGAGRLPRPHLRFEFSILDGGHRIERIEKFSEKK
jgi:tRNA threonylcarbamoyladenosine biosynthesis protein TsaE